MMKLECIFLFTSFKSGIVEEISDFKFDITHSFKYFNKNDHMINVFMVEHQKLHSINQNIYSIFKN